MTDFTHGQDTGGDALGPPEPTPAEAFPVPSRPRFAAAPPPPGSAHSPASPYTVSAVSRPARALPIDEQDEVPLEGGVPVTPVVPAVPVGSALPVDVIPVAPVAPVMSEVPVAFVASEVPVAVPSEAIPAQPVPVAATDPEPDEYIEPPFIPRPYAVGTPAYAPGPPPYSPAVQSEAAPFQPYEFPIPPPVSWVEAETSTPYAAPSADSAPLLTARPYSQPGFGAHVPVPLPAQDAPTAFGSPGAGASFGGPAAPAMATGYGAAKPRTENVGRGLLMALVAVIGGCVLSAVVYHLGFVASIGSLAMGGAGIWLYAKGAGTPPRKGAVPLVVLLVAGILLAWVASLATELYLLYVDRTGTSDGALAFAVSGALSLDLFTLTIKDFLIFVGFGVLGIFGVARQLLAPRKKK